MNVICWVTNVNLLSGNKMLLDKQYYDSDSQASPLVEKYMDLSYSHSLHQLIAEPTTTTVLEHLSTTFKRTLRKRRFRVALLKWGYLTMSSFTVREKRHF